MARIQLMYGPLIVPSSLVVFVVSLIMIPLDYVIGLFFCSKPRRIITHFYLLPTTCLWWDALIFRFNVALVATLTLSNGIIIQMIPAGLSRVRPEVNSGWWSQRLMNRGRSRFPSNILRSRRAHEHGIRILSPTPRHHISTECAKEIHGHLVVSQPDHDQEPI